MKKKFEIFFNLKDNVTNGNRILTRFETTYKMSTYLAAWGIFPQNFHYKETKSSGGIPVLYYRKLLNKIKILMIFL